MLYISKGYKTKILNEVKTENSFDWIANYNPIILKDFEVNNSDAVNDAKDKIFYFISGEMKKNNKGTFLRKDENVLSKDLVVIDYDELEMSSEEFVELINTKLGQFSYILYETVRSRADNVRFRLILKTARNYIKEENKPLIKQITDLIGLPFDNSSNTWSQLQGLPCAFDAKTKQFVNSGLDYPINLLIEPVEISKDQKEKGRLSSRSTTATIKNYIAREKENLKEYSNALSCIMVLAKSVQVGEISLENAKRYAELLAMGIDEWKENNLKKLEAEISNPDIRTNYSFMEKFSKAARNDEKLTTLDCAIEMMKKYHFVIVGSNEDSRLHVYQETEGIYTSNVNYIYRLIYPLEPQFTEAQVRDVYFKIKMQCSVTESENSSHLIPVGNGIYNTKTKKLELFSPEKVFTTKITTNYVNNPKPPSFDIDGWLKEIACDDKEVVQLLWEIINESLNGSYTRGKYFILVGSGNNGKGTFQQLLINLIGEKNISTLKMHEIGEKFKAFQMVGKTMNIGDDIAGNYIEDSSNLQSIVTGDYITVEQKGKDPFTVQLKLAVLFSANEIPKIKNKSNGTYRRMVIIPFNADFNGKVEDRTIKKIKLKQQDVLEYVLHKALQLEFDDFIVPEVVKQQLDDYKEFNDPIVEFYKSKYTEDKTSTLSTIPTNYVYEMYKDFCTGNGYKFKSNRAFVIEFKNLLGERYEKKLARPSREFLNHIYYKKPYEKPVQCFVAQY